MEGKKRACVSTLAEEEEWKRYKIGMDGTRCSRRDKRLVESGMEEEKWMFRDGCRRSGAFNPDQATSPVGKFCSLYKVQPRSWVSSEGAAWKEQGSGLENMGKPLNIPHPPGNAQSLYQDIPARPLHLSPSRRTWHLWHLSQRGQTIAR